jgi:hypothetical protein
MPDRTQLKIGDRIGLLRIPQGDLEQRERELRAGAEDAGWTAVRFERIVAQDPVVTILSIDECGLLWFEYELNRMAGHAWTSPLAKTLIVFPVGSDVGRSS